MAKNDSKARDYSISHDNHCGCIITLSQLETPMAILGQDMMEKNKK
jgi:hypothetical protein